MLGPCRVSPVSVGSEEARCGPAGSVWCGVEEPSSLKEERRANLWAALVPPGRARPNLSLCDDSTVCIHMSLVTGSLPTHLS